MIILLLTGCEGYKTITGTVVARETGLPVAHARIVPLGGLIDSSKSDSVTSPSGKFTLYTKFTGMMFGGPTLRFGVSKDGYQTQLFSSKRGGDTIKLAKNP